MIRTSVPVLRLKVKHIDSADKIIRVEQSKGRKDRNVMLSSETLDLLRQWWKGAPIASSDRRRARIHDTSTADRHPKAGLGRPAAAARDSGGWRWPIEP